MMPDAGRRDEGLTAIQDAVQVYRRLAAENPAAYEPDLATPLTVFATLLAVGGDPYGALRATGDAVELFRSHVAAMPSILSRLSAVLGLQADLLERLATATAPYAAPDGSLAIPASL